MIPQGLVTKLHRNERTVTEAHDVDAVFVYVALIVGVFNQ
jgi:hypothetical protein